MTKAMAEKNWDLAVKLRGKIFESHLHTYKLLTRFCSIIVKIKTKHNLNLTYLT